MLTYAEEGTSRERLKILRMGYENREEYVRKQDSIEGGRK